MKINNKILIISFLFITFFVIAYSFQTRRNNLKNECAKIAQIKFSEAASDPKKTYYEDKIGNEAYKKCLEKYGFKPEDYSFYRYN